MAAGALRSVVGASAAGVLAAVLAVAPAVARQAPPEPLPLADAGVAKVAPDVLVDHILTALMFEPDWRLAVALFQAFQQGAAAAAATAGEGDDGTGEALQVAREILMFLPVDQGREAAPHLLYALAPEADGAQMDLAVDLASLIGADPTDLAARTRGNASTRPALLPLSWGPQLPGPLAGPVDPPPSAAPGLAPHEPVLGAPVRVIGPNEPGSVSADIETDREWALVLYRLLAAMPDYGNASAYAEWYARWEALVAGGAGGVVTPPLLEGGPTASPR